MAVEHVLRTPRSGCNMRIGLYAIDHLLRMDEPAHVHGTKLTIVGATGVENMLNAVAAGQGAVEWDISGKD